LITVTLAKTKNSNSLRLPPPGTVAASDVHLNLYLWALLAVTNLVDVLASRRAFDLGIAELNPLVDSVLFAYGISGIAFLKLFWLAVLLVLLAHIRGWLQAFLAVACLIYLGLTVFHIANLSPLI
jgi:Domain of unknown function (DUF5658)